jgi:hypothetical protein
MQERRRNIENLSYHTDATIKEGMANNPLTKWIATTPDTTLESTPAALISTATTTVSHATSLRWVVVLLVPRLIATMETLTTRAKVVRRAHVGLRAMSITALAHASHHKGLLLLKLAVI